MSLIAKGARGHLDRLAWGNPASQLSSLGQDELRALLQMAQAEGQTEVEKWVRDAMLSQGIYASLHVGAFRSQSKMNARDWLEKAMTLVLAGGILMGGVGVLPVVDQSTASYPTTTIEQVQPGGAMTVEQQVMMEEVRSLFAGIGMRLPSSVTVHWDCNEGNFVGGGKYYSSSDKICMVKGDITTLAHEYAHAWDYHNLTDSQREQYRSAVNERMEDLTGRTDRYTGWLGGSGESYSDQAGEQFARQIEQHLFPSERNQYYMPDILNTIIH